MTIVGKIAKEAFLMHITTQFNIHLSSSLIAVFVLFVVIDVIQYFVIFSAMTKNLSLQEPNIVHRQYSILLALPAFLSIQKFSFLWSIDRNLYRAKWKRRDDENDQLSLVPGIPLPQRTIPEAINSIVKSFRVLITQIYCRYYSSK